MRTGSTYGPFSVFGRSDLNISCNLPNVGQANEICCYSVSTFIESLIFNLDVISLCAF